MKIFKVIKANIKTRKISGIALIILMTIISASISIIVTCKNNINDSIDEAYKHAKVSDLSLNIATKWYTDELKTKLENIEEVDRVQSVDAVTSTYFKFKDKKDSTSIVATRLNKYIDKLYNKNLDGYDSVPPLKKGEVYLSLGLKTNYKLNVGDIVTYYTHAGAYDLKIKGFVLEPVSGSSMMGFKCIYISDEDFDLIKNDGELFEKNNNSYVNIKICYIYKKDKDLSDLKFSKTVFDKSNIGSYSFGSLTKEQAKYYTGLTPSIVCSMLLVFVGILLVIFLIVLGHVLSSSIEMDYTNIGILKSCGFSSLDIKNIYSIQFIIYEIIGCILGIIISIPLTKKIIKLFQPITAILSYDDIYISRVLVIILLIIAFSYFYILFICKISEKISIVNMLNGNLNDVYFDNRFNVPISKRFLYLKLSFRQITSAFKKYMVTIFIVICLVFTMMTITIHCNTLDSGSLLESMGVIHSDLSLTTEDIIAKSDVNFMKNVEDTIESISKITNKNKSTSIYTIVNNESIYTRVKQHDDNKYTKGRMPKYENEMSVSDMFLERNELDLGDSIHISYRGKEMDYIITGTFVSTSDAGINVYLNTDGAAKIGIKNFHTFTYDIEKSDKKDEIYDLINKKYPNVFIFQKNTSITKQLQSIGNLIKYIIYTFSIIFAFIVVFMICSKFLIEERTDIGIYKAFGFTTKRLRLLFATRFAIISIIGSLIGIILSTLFSRKMLIMLLKTIGVTNYPDGLYISSDILILCMLSISFFLFAYCATYKIKRVSTTELIKE